MSLLVMLALEGFLSWRRERNWVFWFTSCEIRLGSQQ